MQQRRREWYPNAVEALEALDQAWPAFRAGVANLGEHGLWRPLGPAWEEFAGDPWIGLVLHAQDERCPPGPTGASSRACSPAPSASVTMRGLTCSSCLPRPVQVAQ